MYPPAFYSSLHTAGVAIGSVVSLALAPLAAGVLERLVDKHPLGRRWTLAAPLGTAGSTLLRVAKIEVELAGASPRQHPLVQPGNGLRVHPAAGQRREPATAG